MRLVTDADWQQLRQVVIGGVLTWAMLRGAGWIVGVAVCGCAP